VTFAGSAPSIGETVFDKCSPDFSIYYNEGKTGFTTPKWSGYPCSPINRR
jgi:hypothetical protein